MPVTRSLTQKDDLSSIAQAQQERERSLQFLNEWKEDHGGASAFHTQRRLHNLRMQELHMANRELILVRRAALRRLLEDETRQYKEELNLVGKTFHLQRL